MREKKLTQLYALLVVFVLCLLSTVAGPGSSDTEKHISKKYYGGTIDQYLTEGHGSVFYVGGTGPGNYSTIRNAMNAASDGDTIVVYPGIYEEDLIIKKSLHFIGRNKKTTIIDPENSPYTLSIDAHNVTLQGFTIKNTNNHACGISIRAIGVIIHNIIIDCASYLNKGIYIRNTNNTTLYDNSLINGGIYLENSYHNTIFNNIINGQPLTYLENQQNIHIESTAGQVILVNCSNITVRNAHLKHLFCGIQIVNSHTCLIEENLLDTYLRHAMELTSSKNINLFNNTFKDGDINLFCSTNIHVINNEMTEGMNIDASHHNTIAHNDFLGSSSIVIKAHSKDNTVKDNIITRGITLENSQETTITQNTIRDCGIRIVSSSSTTLEENLLEEDDLSFYNSPRNLMINNVIKESGVDLHNSSHNVLIGNIIASHIYNSRGDITLYLSNYTTMVNNSLEKKGLCIEESYHNSIENNTVNGQALIYMENKKNSTVPQDAGQIILVNCEHINVHKQHITNRAVGLYLINTHHCLITHNTLRQNEFESIQLYQSHNNTLCDNNMSFNNKHSGHYNAGVLLFSSFHTVIVNNTLLCNGHGLYLHLSQDTVMSGNTISQNRKNALTIDKCNRTTLTKNIITNNGGNIEFFVSHDNIICDNWIEKNDQGLLITSSINNTIMGNSFDSNCILFSDSSHNIVLDNVINGKPLVYLEHEDSIAVEHDAGQILIVNCTNIIVRHVHLENIPTAILLVDSNNCRILDNTIFNTSNSGICIANSHTTLILGNTILNSSMGIYLSSAWDNVITTNIIKNNTNTGIYLGQYSINNNIEQNILSDNEMGLSLQWSSLNTIKRNRISNNDIGIYLSHGSFDNRVTKNTLSNNDRAIIIHNAAFTMIANNNFEDNSEDASFAVAAYYYEKWALWNRFNRNYWGEPQLLPKAIKGEITIIYHDYYGGSITHKWIYLDRHPRQLPNPVHI